MDSFRSDIRFDVLPEKRKLLTKKKLVGFGFILLVAAAYGVRFEKARQFRANHEESYRRFSNLEGIEVPPGPIQAPETSAPPEPYSVLHLNHAFPASSDDKGNLILYFPADSTPEDYKGPKKTGYFVRSTEGKYSFLGEIPCTYTTDGRIIRTWKDDARGGFVVSIDGKQPGFSPIRHATFQVFSAPPVIASKSITIPLVLFYSDPKMSKDGGELFKLPKTAPTGESLLISAFRKVGLFEPNSPSAIFRGMRITKDDRVIAQFWSNYDIYQGMRSRYGKLYEYRNEDWRPIAQLNNYSLNTEYYVAPSGVIGANWIANCSYASRPLILDNEKLNILPIPEGFVYAELKGVNKHGSALITATGQGRTSKGFLWHESKFYPFEAISKELGDKRLFGRYGPALPRNVEVPDKYEALRSKLQNPLLENGDMVFADAEQNGKFFLVSKTQTTASRQ